MVAALISRKTRKVGEIANVVEGAKINCFSEVFAVVS